MSKKCYKCNDYLLSDEDFKATVTYPDRKLDVPVCGRCHSMLQSKIMIKFLWILIGLYGALLILFKINS